MDPKIRKMLEFIEGCSDAAKLRQLVDNAANEVAKNPANTGAAELVAAARRKLYRILPSEQPGTIEHAVWQSIYALEDVLKQERGKTVLLARTRQKIARQGVTRCVADLVTGTASEGFRMLKERDMLELSFESIALQFPDAFEHDVLDSARERLRGAGFRVS